MKIVKSYEESGLLIKGVSETTENQAKQQEEGFLSMLLGTVGATLLGNLLISKRNNKRAGKRTARFGQNF